MLGEHSPQKENRSPSPKKHAFSSQGKSTVVLQELRQILKNHNIPIPPHLKNQDENGILFLKNTQIADPDQPFRLRAKLGDKQFEVRRLEEDFAEYKLLTRLEHQKNTKKLKEQISQLKNKLVEENKNWEAKFQETSQRLSEECRQFKSETESFFMEMKKKEVSELKAVLTEKNRQLQNELNRSIQEFRTTVDQLKADFALKLEKVQSAHEQQVNSLNQHLQQTVKKTEEVFEAKIIAVECEKNAEVKETKQVKQVTAKREQKLLKQIGLLSRDKNALFQKLQDAEMRLKVAQKKLDDLSKELERVKSQNDCDKSQLKSELQRVRNETERMVESERLKILKENYEKTSFLQKRLQDLQSLKDTMVEELKDNQKVLDRRFSRRQSRKEDVELIKQIEYRLMEKERETAQLYNNLRYFKLQKQNNDKIYTKIFSSHKQKKGSRNDRDICSILRQAQTTDVRHMLRIAPKESHKK